MNMTHNHLPSKPSFFSHAVLGALLTLASACASSNRVIVDGRPVSRVKLGYTDGKYFAVTHSNAYPVPRGPSSGLRAGDGSVFGRVCGADIYFNSDYYRSKLEMNGFIRAHSTERRVPDLASWVRVRDVAKDGRAEREFSGAFGLSTGTEGVNPRNIAAILRGFTQAPGGAVANWQISGILSGVGGSLASHSAALDLLMSPERLHGRISYRRFDLQATEDDSYVGEMWVADEKYRFVVFGKSALWSMPPADQAAILPFMLSCARLVQDDLGEPILFVDFSGKYAGRKS
jgi:hypothetical protein